MGERSPESKQDEQYPLLKIDGGGDVNQTQPTPTVTTTGWGINYNKNKRFVRWPEIISACWMTLILCGISFLVFHALGMGLYRRQQFIIMKCNNSKPASNVFYHHIVPRGNQIPFVLYTEYLANMARQYPLLHFNVYFLVDDYYSEVRRSSKRVPVFFSWINDFKLEDADKEAFNEFQKIYQNVNVTIMPLSKFMAMTPLRFKWRLIPQTYLTFYARVFSVWQNGGVGIDLRTFNNEYHNQLVSNPRIDAILKQHNDGINSAEYTKSLNKIDNDEANAILSMFCSFFNNFLNETRSFFNKTLAFPTFSNEKTLVRTHRSKRQTNDNTVKLIVDDAKNYYNVAVNSSNVPSADHLVKKNQSNDINSTSDSVIALVNQTHAQNSTEFGKRNESDSHKVVLFYDFSIVSDNFFAPPLTNIHMHKPPTSTKAHFLSIDTEGTFIAASSRLHPLLTHLISAGCFGKPPRFAIHNAFWTQCSGSFKDDTYCNNIFIL